ncbi:MAG: 50S ribosomal protein L30 [Acidilobaceae archaeon]|nr:50S ribosomal protein L30 [Acidilobaceae archaeon]MCX8165739.1 50S ribosomal protein L30 [Acidilobaceae archaeon]MDW7974164.1 50S ribosomal protein L30 [Sulfolobales archaeon]
MPLYAIIRLRGTADISPEVEDTLSLLRLRRRFAASLYWSELPGLEGMLKVIAPWATWGEVEEKVLAELIARRGRLVGDKKITDEWVRQNLGLRGIEELAQKLVAGELHYHKLEEKGVKPFFRLTPPKGGFKKSIKKMGKDGELGYRGEKINELLMRMM